MDGTITATGKRRGRPPLAKGALHTARAKDDRVNVSMDKPAQEALTSVQTKLADRLGFTPTITQTLLWLVSRADLLIAEIEKLP